MNSRYRVAVVTVSRSDYGCLRSILHRVVESNALELQLVVGGTHLEPRFGETVQIIEADGYQIAANIPMKLTDDSRLGIARSAALAHAGFAESYAALAPDIVVVFGDRFEMHAAAVAAVPFGIPIVHLHGGELTLGAFDDSLRHSITKLAHLHFTAARCYHDRVIQMGEEPWRVEISGAPGIDTVLTTPRMSPEQLEMLLGMPLRQAPLLVTFHPATLHHETAVDDTRILISALIKADCPIVVTAPNSDTGSSGIRAELERFANTRENVRLVESLDTSAYAGLMDIAAAMVGNSSSGLIEAPSFGLPVINIGDRQAGRLRASNVFDVPCEKLAILNALHRVEDPLLRTRLKQIPNPYGDGRAAERIVGRLERREPRGRLLAKEFYELGPQVGDRAN